MSAPCVLIASCTDFHPKEIVKNILGTPVLPTGEPVTETIEAYPWHIDTKYYTANIHLCTTETRTIGDREFADTVQGLVLFFDTAEESSFQQVKSWLPFVKELEPQVQLLVCESCKESDRISRQHALTWCLENAFELVELDPVENCDIEDDDFQETTGIKRVIQALHAHPWPNLVMKDRPAFRSSLMTQMMADEVNNRRLESDEQTPSTDASETPESASTVNDSSSGAGASSSVPSAPTAEESEAISQKSAKELRNLEEQRHNRTAGATGGAEGGRAGASSADPVHMTASKAEKKQKNEEEKQKYSDGIEGMLDEDMAMFRVLGEEDNEESFEELFERMRLMKGMTFPERAEHLPPEERKKYAEKVALAFWKAIGGDEDEIEGISGSDDEDDVVDRV